jgi:hypothetical protein
MPIRSSGADVPPGLLFWHQRRAGHACPRAQFNGTTSPRADSHGRLVLPAFTKPSPHGGFLFSPWTLPSAFVGVAPALSSLSAGQIMRGAIAILPCLIGRAVSRPRLGSPLRSARQHLCHPGPFRCAPSSEGIARGPPTIVGLNRRGGWGGQWTKAINELQAMHW